MTIPSALAKTCPHVYDFGLRGDAQFFLIRHGDRYCIDVKTIVYLKAKMCRYILSSIYMTDM